MIKMKITEGQNSILEECENFKKNLIKELEWNIKHHKTELKINETKLKNVDLIDFKIKE